METGKLFPNSALVFLISLRLAQLVSKVPNSREIIVLLITTTPLNKIPLKS